MQMNQRAQLDVSDATAEWLTAVLRANGHLPHGEVESIERTGEASVHAHTARLRITYSAAAEGTLPPSLFLKVCKEGSASFAGGPNFNRAAAAW